MGNFTTSADGNAVEFIGLKPKSSTIELIRQYARVCTPLTSIAFSQLISN